jgi:hypothetical protein
VASGESDDKSHQEANAQAEGNRITVAVLNEGIRAKGEIPISLERDRSAGKLTLSDGAQLARSTPTETGIDATSQRER